MKVLIPISIFFFASCFSTPRDLEMVTYPIPMRKKVILFQMNSPSFYNSYSEEKEINLRILEELEESGYSVVLGDLDWEESIPIEPNDHLGKFQEILKQQSQEEEVRIQVWKKRAEKIGASEVFLLRFRFSFEQNTIPVRLFWIKFSDNEVKRFDWFWNEKDVFPFRKFIRQNPAGKL